MVNFSSKLTATAFVTTKVLAAHHLMIRLSFRNLGFAFSTAQHRDWVNQGICKRSYAAISHDSSLMLCQDGYMRLIKTKPTAMQKKLPGNEATQSKNLDTTRKDRIRRWYIILHRALQSRNNSNSYRNFYFVFKSLGSGKCEILKPA